MLTEDPPPGGHQCFDEYEFMDFNGTSVKLICQELTRTVEHHSQEKRFFHMMFQSGDNRADDPAPMELMRAISRDYIGSLFNPLNERLARIRADLALPRLNPDNMEWVELLQGSLTASLMYFEKKLAATQTPCAPTCCPHIIVNDPDNPEQVLFAHLSVALHCVHPTPDNPDDGDDSGTGGHHGGEHPHPDHG
jgi:hypothetical protein